MLITVPRAGALPGAGVPDGELLPRERAHEGIEYGRLAEVPAH
ncbi:MULTISPECIES: hypothetical protein [unclassified Streptomyces]|nr:hypothetical protein [Streptomyces sp. SJL17-1]